MEGGQWGAGAGGGVLQPVLLLRLAVTAAVLTCAACHEPVRHTVGGSFGWSPNVNYSDWAKNQTFYIGDWLYFVFDKHQYNVLEVNETSYGNCTDKDFIKNITHGGRDVFNLSETKPYYFLSSGGYCFHGMRLAVSVHDIPSPPLPAPAPPNNSSPAICRCWILSFVALQPVAVAFFFFFFLSTS
ncbi:early nodulin-like protein 20 [Malania oleifera]|uniref:early nodulin-like protein 20 n=1 Tax=Malania oleifera TaxID=397392 RepID=UPI0025AE33BC|nr:early nodulin-like protein 20 [Malania oleifera]